MNTDSFLGLIFDSRLLLSYKKREMFPSPFSRLILFYAAYFLEPFYRFSGLLFFYIFVWSLPTIKKEHMVIPSSPCALFF